MTVTCQLLEMEVLKREAKDRDMDLRASPKDSHTVGM